MAEATTIKVDIVKNTGSTAQVAKRADSKAQVIEEAPCKGYVAGPR